MYVTKSTRHAMIEPLIIKLSFLACLKGQLSLVGVNVKVLQCHVSLMYIFSAEITKLHLCEKSRFHYVLSIYEKPFEIPKLLQWPTIRKKGMGFPTTPT